MVAMVAIFINVKVCARIVGYWRALALAAAVGIAAWVAGVCERTGVRDGWRRGLGHWREGKGRDETNLIV